MTKLTVISIISALLVIFAFAKAEIFTTKFQGEDYNYLIVHEQKLKWKDALDACREEDMNLISLISEERSNELNEYLLTKGYVFDYNKSDLADYIYWTSGHYISEVKKFKWESINRMFDDGDWLNWYQGMPDNMAGFEYCLEMGYRRNMTETIGQWNDVRCDSLRHYICESRTNAGA